MSVLVVILHEKNCSKDRHGFENHGVLLYSTILKSNLEVGSITVFQQATIRWQKSKIKNDPQMVDYILRRTGSWQMPNHPPSTGSHPSAKLRLLFCRDP